LGPEVAHFVVDDLLTPDDLEERSDDRCIKFRFYTETLSVKVDGKEAKKDSSPDLPRQIKSRVIRYLSGLAFIMINPSDDAANSASQAR
jgi:hypothetical protein